MKKLNRRSFLKLPLAAGISLAVSPLLSRLPENKMSGYNLIAENDIDVESPVTSEIVSQIRIGSIRSSDIKVGDIVTFDFDDDLYTVTE